MASLKSKYLKWEQDLNERVKILRSERKILQGSVSSLLEELEEAKVFCI